MVNKKVSRYNEYRVNKLEKHAAYRELQIPEILEGVYKFIAIDQITKLPKSYKLVTNIEYNSIIVIIDSLTKYTYFILYREALIV